MKYIIKLIISFLVLLLLVIVLIIAIVKTIFVITVLFVWETGNKWHGEMLIKLHKFMQWLK